MNILKTKGLKLCYSNGESETLTIYKGKTWTPFRFCVDHDDYYEIAKWSSYIRVDKATMRVTSNRKNADVFETCENITAEIVKFEKGEIACAIQP